MITSKRCLSFCWILLLGCTPNHRPKQISNTPKSTVLQAPFIATFWTGDESVEKYQLKVYAENGKVWAQKLSPNYYYGTATDSVWKVEVTDGGIALCNHFLRKAKRLPKECPYTFTGVNRHLIIAGIDTLHIRGECNWGNVPYHRLERELFKTQFLDLEKKRKALEDSLLNAFDGRWYLFPSSGELQKDDKLILRREPSNSNRDCYWTFTSNYGFKGNCEPLLDLFYSNKFRWDIDEGSVLFEIAVGGTYDENGNVEVGNSGAM